MSETRDFSVETVCTLPADLDAQAITSDGHVVSFWEGPDEGVRFGWDGRAAHPPFDGVATMRDGTPAIVVSSDGAHVAYLGLRSGQVFVGRDDGEDQPMPGFTRSVPLVFSHDGRHLAYGMLDGDDARLILDGQPTGGRLAPIAAVFSPDGERLAYVEIQGSTRSDAEVRIVLDGHAGDWMPGMRNAGGAMQFSPDSSRFAHCRGLDGGRMVQWVIDGAPQRAYHEVRSIGLAQVRGIGVLEGPLNARFSPDGRRFAYFADVPEKGVAIVEDDVAGPVLKGVGWITFSPDSRHVAYLGQRPDGQMGLVVDGILGRTWNAKEMGQPVFSPDSRRIAVVVERHEGGMFRKRKIYSLLVDGQVVAEAEGDDASLNPVFSPDGEHVAWWVTQGSTTQMWLDDHPHAGGGRSLSAPLFTQSGSLVYAVAPEGQDTAAVSVAGQLGPVASDMALPRTARHTFGGDGSTGHPVSLSPDSEHVAWIGQFGADWRPVLDALVGPAFDTPIAAGFSAGDRATWDFQSGDRVMRVTVSRGRIDGG